MRGTSRKLRSFGKFGNYLRNKNKPRIANETPTILCHDGAPTKQKG